MRTKKGFKLREVCGEKILLAEGVENIDFSDIISMNASSAYLWEQVDGKDFTVERWPDCSRNNMRLKKLWRWKMPRNWPINGSNVVSLRFNAINALALNRLPDNNNARYKRLTM